VRSGARARFDPPGPQILASLVLVGAVLWSFSPMKARRSSTIDYSTSCDDSIIESRGGDRWAKFRKSVKTVASSSIPWPVSLLSVGIFLVVFVQSVLKPHWPEDFWSKDGILWSVEAAAAPLNFVGAFLVGLGGFFQWRVFRQSRGTMISEKSPTFDEASWGTVTVGIGGMLVALSAGAGLL
jgi:hypothetical protein